MSACIGRLTIGVGNAAIVVKDGPLFFEVHVKSKEGEQVDVDMSLDQFKKLVRSLQSVEVFL